MVADMQAFEQEMVEGYLNHLSCSANATESAATAHHRDLLSLQREAQALQDAEAEMQQDLEVAAEIKAETEHLALCSDRLREAADLILDSGRIFSLAPTTLHEMMSAANHLLSKCQMAKDVAQQTEMQLLKDELHQLKKLHKEDTLRYSDLQRTNRYALLEHHSC